MLERTFSSDGVAMIIGVTALDFGIYAATHDIELSGWTVLVVIVKLLVSIMAIMLLYQIQKKKGYGWRILLSVVMSPVISVLQLLTNIDWISVAKKEATPGTLLHSEVTAHIPSALLHIAIIFLLAVVIMGAVSTTAARRAE